MSPVETRTHWKTKPKETGPVLVHVLSTSYMTTHRLIVHFLSVDGTETLCGLMKSQDTMHGTVIQKVFPTDQDVTCQPCRKALEMVIRGRLHNLSSRNLEDMYEVMYELLSDGGNANGQARQAEG